DINENELFEEVNLLIKENPRKTVKNTLKGIVPERFLDYILKRHDIPEDLKCGNLRKDTLQNILEDIKNFKFIVNGSLSIEKEFVTGDGISTIEILLKTIIYKL